MNDGRNGSPEVPAVIPDRAQSTPSPEAPPALPAGVWAVPPETAALLRDIDNHCSALLQRLGSLEVEYLASKYAAIDELKARRALFKNLVDETARKAGLDIDKARWAIDTRTMTLVRAS